jgi:hypothetical protein
VTRPPRPTLRYGGLVVGRVFSVNRAAGTADVLLAGANPTGTWQRVRVTGVTGSRRHGPYPSEVLTDDEVRAELDWRAGIALGAWPVVQLTADEAGAVVVDDTSKEASDA